MFAQLWFLVVVAWTITQLVVADWIDDLTGWGSDVLGAVYDWVRGFVKSAIRTAHGVIMSALHSVSDWLLGICNWVLGVALAAVGDVTNALAWWVGVLWDAITTARNFAQWLNDVTSSALSWATGVLWAGIQSVADAAYRQMIDLAGWVVEHVFTPLAKSIADVLDYIGTTFTHWVQDIANNLWCFVKDVAGSIGGIAEGVVSDALGPFLTVLDVSLKAIRWLVFMATHPFDWFFHLFDDFFAKGSQYLLDKLAHAVQSNFSTVDNWLSRFFE